MIRRLLLVAPLLAGAALTGCAPNAAGPVGPPVGASGSAGIISITGAYVGDDGSSSYLPLYLTLHSSGAHADLLEAVIAPAATSATWVVAHKVHTPAEIAAFAEPCGANPQLLAESNAALARAGDVIVPAGGSVQLSPGIARIQLNGIDHHVKQVPVTLYFLSGAVVHLVVPADGPTEADPLGG